MLYNRVYHMATVGVKGLTMWWWHHWHGL